ncbi:MAG TPA: alpha/beta hydrolase [Methylotenera sp.]|nr:alpha/beta hydrolase [Methylotenera sp.]HPH04624.1 alpha/beta hydrolase [Methylotenera sp.]HPN01603.1 alpha/beta hydrolase [Methylotenera sp.]
MLFPAHLAMPVVADWQPKAGSQAFLAGQCGKLYVAKWPVANEKGTVMVFHGNAESLVSVERQVPMFQAQGYSVMAWDYAGYGQSENCWSSEQGILHDAEIAYLWLVAQTQLPIVIYGRSVGSGPAVYIASKYAVQKLLLVSPYDTLANVAAENMPFFVPVRYLMRFPLDSTQWIKHVKAPIYAIHGLTDTLIKPARALKLFGQAKQKISIKWVKSAGHNVDSAAQFEPWLASSLN